MIAPNFRDLRSMFPRIVTLKPGREGDASGEIKVQCSVTAERLRWNDACKAGWVVDNRPENGKWIEYLSPEGQAARGVKLEGQP